METLSMWVNVLGYFSTTAPTHCLVVELVVLWVILNVFPHCFSFPYYFWRSQINGCLFFLKPWCQSYVLSSHCGFFSDLCPPRPFFLKVKCFSSSLSLSPPHRTEGGGQWGPVGFPPKPCCGSTCSAWSLWRRPSTRTTPTCAATGRGQFPQFRLLFSIFKGK